MANEQNLKNSNRIVIVLYGGEVTRIVSDGLVSEVLLVNSDDTDMMQRREVLVDSKMIDDYFDHADKSLWFNGYE